MTTAILFTTVAPHNVRFMRSNEMAVYIDQSETGFDRQQARKREAENNIRKDFIAYEKVSHHKRRENLKYCLKNTRS